MFHRPLGCYCSYCASKLVTGTSKRKENITTEGTPHIVQSLTFYKLPGAEMRAVPQTLFASEIEK